MIEASTTSITNLLGSVSGYGSILFLAILGILLWEAVIVLSAVVATVGISRRRDRAGRG
jgi:hypothetical protein